MKKIENDKKITPLAKRLGNLITDGKGLRKYLDVSAQAINQYKLGISRPSLENLCKIADYYGVSVDFLLGRTDTPTIIEDIATAEKTTGLCAESVLALQEISKNNADAVNLIIRSDHFKTIIKKISDSAKYSHNIGCLLEKLADKFDSISAIDWDKVYKFETEEAVGLIFDEVSEALKNGLKCED